MRVDHTMLEPIKGASGREKTAVTMKTIQQLLDEEAAKKTFVPVSPKPEADEAPEAAPVAATLKASTAPVVEAEKTVPPMPLPNLEEVQQAPSKAKALPEITPMDEAEAEKPRSLLGRLLRR